MCDGLGDWPGLVTRSSLHHCSLSQWPHAISHRWGQSSPSLSSPSPVSTVTWGVKHEVLSWPVSASLDDDNEMSHAGSCLCLSDGLRLRPGADSGHRDVVSR